MNIKLLFLLLTISFATKGQKIEAIFVNLYTDSLKKGTLNYINIDGKLSNGKYLPLDSTKIIFTCKDAKFTGNSIFIPIDFKAEKVSIKTTLKSDILIFKEFEIFIKKMEDPPLKITEEIKPKQTTKKRRGKK